MRCYFRLAGYDLYMSLQKHKKKFVLVFLIGIIACLWMEHAVRLLEAIYLYPRVTLGDYLFYLLKGVQFYGRTEWYELPEVWLIFQTMLLFLMISYPFEDANTVGQQVMIRTRSKGQWWLGKCIWVVLFTVLYYALMYGAVVLYCAVRNIPLTFSLSAEFAEFYYGVDNILDLEKRDFLLMVFAAIPMMSAAMGMLQQLLALWIKPQAAFLIALGYLFVSIYRSSPVFLGNYMMAIRYTQVSDLPYVTPGRAILTAGAVIVFCAAVGMRKFEKYDILGGATL